MNDEELNTNLSAILEHYVGRTIDFTSEVELVNTGSGLSSIASWNISGVSEPTIESLRTYNLADIETTKRKKKNKQTLTGCSLPVLTASEITEINASVGMIVYNTTTDTVQVYNGTSWNTL